MTPLKKVWATILAHEQKLAVFAKLAFSNFCFEPPEAGISVQYSPLDALQVSV